jgi:hypothetical protein
VHTHSPQAQTRGSVLCLSRLSEASVFRVRPFLRREILWEKNAYRNRVGKREWTLVVQDTCAKQEAKQEIKALCTNAHIQFPCTATGRQKRCLQAHPFPYKVCGGAHARSPFAPLIVTSMGCLLFQLILRCNAISRTANACAQAHHI